MYNIDKLTREQLLFNYHRQKAWLEHYNKIDPCGAGIKTTKSILKVLASALVAPGVRC